MHAHDKETSFLNKLSESKLDSSKTAKAIKMVIGDFLLLEYVFCFDMLVVRIKFVG
jgi:hypothetical protein